MRYRSLLGCTAALMLALPAAAGAQRYDLGAGGTIVGDFSSAGCGTFFCLTLEAGNVPDSFFGPGLALRSAFVRVKHFRTTAAFDLLARGTLYDFLIPGFVSFTSCNPDGRGGLRCWGDGGRVRLGGGTTLDVPGPREVGIGPLPTYLSFEEFSTGPVQFTAYLPDARTVIASESFAPALVVLPEPATFALSAAGLAVVGVLARGARGRA